MAFLNGCIWVAASAGTGSFVFSAASPGFFTPTQAGAANATYNYTAVQGTDREVGFGTFNTGTGTLTRTVVLSTNANAAVNFASPPTVQMGCPLAGDGWLLSGGPLGTPSSATLTNATGLPSILGANEASDTTCFPVFFTAATGELGPKTNAGLTFNAATALLYSTLMSTTAIITTAWAPGYVTTATAAGTTTLTVASAFYQYFTGTSNQTIVLPVATTLTVGWNVMIVNKGTGRLTVQSSGSNTVWIVDGNSTIRVVCILASGTTAASWDVIPLYTNLPQNSQSAAYTTVLSDQGKQIFHPAADTTARTWTIDSNANVPYPIGTVITFTNQNGAGVITIAITSDTMRLAGAGTTGNRTLAANGTATAQKVAPTEWLISGVGLT